MKWKHHYPLESKDPKEQILYNHGKILSHPARWGCTWDRTFAFDRDIFLHLCRNIESLAIDLNHYRDGYTFKLCPPPTDLPALKHLKFKYNVYHHVDSYRYSDEEEYSDMDDQDSHGNMQLLGNNHIITSLLIAGRKSLESLECNWIKGCFEYGGIKSRFRFVLGSLKKAKFTSSLMSQDDFKILFQLMPNLESFHYKIPGGSFFEDEYDSDDEYYYNSDEGDRRRTKPADQVRNAAVKCHSLKHLYLDLGPREKQFRGVEWKKEKFSD
ncbi:hypothetical protein QBC38DRAFT_491788 [Podospora fimiseda]|uniref:Uncharacterized protein n=1 Tax=Podospora fimiseda TaxID=252190 RepID=A0AAN6YRQ0_9PEZI|nr:hypothetical protein QBC38DRAFT_491788 [Podospora fimiseda]